MIFRKNRNYFPILSLLFSGILFYSFTQIHTPVKADDEKYKVIKVSGKIEFKESGTLLKQGDVFTAKTELEFKTPESRAAVISPGKGRFILTASNSKGKSSNLIPAMNTVETRGGSILNLIQLQTIFSENLVILNKLKLIIGKQAFPMNDDHFFYLEYMIDNDTIYKKLEYNADTLLLNPKNIFRVDQEEIEIPERKIMILYYRNEKENKTLRVAEFEAIMPDMIQFKSEIKILIENLKDTKSKKKLSEILAFISDFYGHPDKENVSEYIQKNFK